MLISVPENRKYGQKEYDNSGSMTAHAILAAFSRNALKVDTTNNCHGEKCLKTIDPSKYDYYVMPTILHWEDRATEWPGKSDRIEVKIEIYDAQTSELLANLSYTGKSKFMSWGGEHPQDLLTEPTNTNVSTPYH